MQPQQVLRSKVKYESPMKDVSVHMSEDESDDYDDDVSDDDFQPTKRKKVCPPPHHGAHHFSLLPIRFCFEVSFSACMNLNFMFCLVVNA